MLEWIKKHKKGIIRGMFLFPIILVMIISISHVVSWYSLSNPLSWAIYLSIAIEIAAMSSIAAASVKVKGGVWFVFIIVTLIQFIGNIYFSYKEIDITSQNFKDWVELTTPVFEGLGSDVSDFISQRRWLALLQGGLLPIISLASLHFFIKYDGIDDEKITTTEPKINPPTPTLDTLPIVENTDIEPELVIETVEQEVITPIIEDPISEITENVEEPIIEVTTETDTTPNNVQETLLLNAKKKVEGTDKWG